MLKKAYTEIVYGSAKVLEFFLMSLEPIKKVNKPTPTNRSKSFPPLLKKQNKRLPPCSRKSCNLLEMQYVVVAMLTEDVVPLLFKKLSQFPVSLSYGFI